MTFEEIEQNCRKLGYENQLKNVDKIEINKYKMSYIRESRKEQAKRKDSLLEKIRTRLGKLDATFEEWFEWSLCRNEGYNKHFSILLRDLVDNIDNYHKVYHMLSDDASRQIFEDLCEWRFSRNSALLVDAYSVSKNKQYFEPFEFLSSKEIFVDCGGYIGDSSMDLIAYTGGVSKVWLYEADEKNIDIAKRNLSGYDVMFRNVGVSDKNGEMSFCSLGLGTSSFSDVDQENNSIVKLVSIDGDIPISEEITFLKMDIEGMELKALTGAEQHIKKYRPVLAICLYHNPEDLWKLPLCIKSYTEENYNYYIRHYTMYHGETVFYAVPKERSIDEK